MILSLLKNFIQSINNSSISILHLACQSRLMSDIAMLVTMQTALYGTGRFKDEGIFIARTDPKLLNTILLPSVKSNSLDHFSL